jgi:hypothetical protein
MPEQYQITDTETGRTLTVTGDAAPTEQEAVEIFASLVPQQEPSQTTAPKAAPRTPVTPAERQPPPSVSSLAMEGIAAFNRPFAWLADRTLLAPVNAVLQLQGKPALSIESALGQKGQFAGDGFLVDAASAAGELASLSLGFGTGARVISSMLDDAARIGGNTLERVLLELGKSTPKQDLTLGGVSGLGGEVTAYGGVDLFGPEAEQGSRIVGQVISPGVWTATTASLINAGEKLFKSSVSGFIEEAAPSTQALLGAGRGLFTKLDEAGVRATATSSQDFARNIEGFLVNENITSGLYPTANRMAREVITKAKGKDISFGYLLDVSSLLRRTAATEIAEAPKLLRFADDIDNFMDTGMTPTDPSKLGVYTIESARTTARSFWRRGMTSETLDNIFNNAAINSESRGSSFSNEIKTGLTSLLKNKTALRSFTTDEVKQIRDVIKGDSAENTYKLFAKLSPSSDDWFKGVMFSTLGAGVATISGAPGTAVGAGLLATFTVGRMAQMRAGQLLQQNANLMRSTIQAGKNANDITKAYFSATPRSLRNPEDLASLFLSSGANIAPLASSPTRSQSKFIADAIFYTQLGQAAMQKEEAQEQQQ